jgi:hypothetical protein
MDTELRARAALDSVRQAQRRDRELSWMCLLPSLTHASTELCPREYNPTITSKPSKVREFQLRKHKRLPELTLWGQAQHLAARRWSNSVESGRRAGEPGFVHCT